MRSSAFTLLALALVLIAGAGTLSAQGTQPAPVPPTVPPITISL